MRTFTSQSPQIFTAIIDRHKMIGYKPGVIALVEGTDEEVFLPFHLMRKLGRMENGDPVFTGEESALRRVDIGEEVFFTPNINPNGKGRASSWAPKGSFEQSGQRCPLTTWGERFRNRWRSLFSKASKKAPVTPPISLAPPRIDLSTRTIKVSFNTKDCRLFRIWDNRPDGCRNQIDCGHLKNLASRMYIKGSIGPDITVEVHEGRGVWTLCEKNPLEDAPFSPE
ncbi:MAG: hypothetical protein WC629_02810 [Candidatus Paceibacterota bacterium]|jgi:hypothetical protein